MKKINRRSKILKISILAISSVIFLILFGILFGRNIKIEKQQSYLDAYAQFLISEDKSLGAYLILTVSDDQREDTDFYRHFNDAINPNSSNNERLKEAEYALKIHEDRYLWLINYYMENNGSLVDARDELLKSINTLANTEDIDKVISETLFLSNGHEELKVLVVQKLNIAIGLLDEIVENRGNPFITGNYGAKLEKFISLRDEQQILFEELNTSRKKLNDMYYLSGGETFELE